MRTLLIALILPSIGCSLAPTAPRFDSTIESPTSLALSFGQSSFDSDWEPVDDVKLAGIEIATAPASGPGFEAGILTGSDDTTVAGVNVDAEHLIGYVGLRKTWHRERLHPYIGAGIEANRAEVDFAVGGGSISDDDTAVGGYVHVGVQIDLAESGSWFFAIDGRYGGIGAEHKSNKLGIELDSQYTLVSAQLGLRF